MCLSFKTLGWKSLTFWKNWRVTSKELLIIPFVWRKSSKNNIFSPFLWMKVILLVKFIEYLLFLIFLLSLVSNFFVNSKRILKLKFLGPFVSTNWHKSWNLFLRLEINRPETVVTVIGQNFIILWNGGLRLRLRGKARSELGGREEKMKSLI